MGIFQSKTYDVQKEEVKTIPRNKKSDHTKSRASVKSKSDTLPQHDSTYIPLKPTEDAIKINNFGLNLPDYDENEPEVKVKETNEHEGEQTSSEKAAENSEIANAAVSNQTISIGSETAPTQVENSVPEERESKSENKNGESPDAILVVNDEPVVEATPFEKAELAEMQRRRSIAIENEIFQAVAHIPERRDSRMADVTKEETTKNQLSVQEENTQSAEEKVNSTLDISSTEVLKNEEKLELVEPIKMQPESPAETLSTEPVQVGQDQVIHKGEEEDKVEATLEETVHLHESEFKKVKIGVPVLQEVETKKEETIETDICKLQDIRANDITTNDDNSKAEATIEKQNENENTCAIQAEIKLDHEVHKEALEQNEETKESSSKLDVNEEVSKAEVKDENKSININQEAACPKVVVQETEKQNKAITIETDQKKENIGNDHAVEEQNVINQSKDDNSGNVATEELVILTEAERAEIIEEMCSKVNQVPFDLESRRISLIMKDLPEAKVQEKEPVENHVVELQEQSSSFKEVSENLRQIQEIEEDVKTIKAQVFHFPGTSPDSEYLTLHETLVRNIIKLDDILVGNDEEVRQERKRVIKFTQQCLNDLEGKLQKSKASDDSDSE